MQDFTQYFKDKKITVMRIGLIGRGIGDTRYLVESGAKVTVVDDAPQEVMQPAVDALSDLNNIEFKFGPYDFADFKDADFVLVGAGAPLKEPVLEQCRENKIPLRQSAAWFAELAGIPVIGVTGTRGKSTVTHMIHHVLQIVTDGEVLLGGNIRGVSNLQLLNQVHEDSLAVMELDSWQLQGWGWQKMSPQIAVFTNFMPDHLNYYQTDGTNDEEAMQLYFEDKANIFRYQEESGVFVTVPDVFEQAKSLSGVTLGQEVVLADESVLPKDMVLSMPGEHNRLNAALAYAALKATSLSDEEIFHGLSMFPGVPGRLEYLGEREGVRIYNDNNSTTPQATIKGLQAVGDVDDKNVILIAGGSYKKLDPTPMLEEIKKYCKKVVLLPGAGTDMIKDIIKATVVTDMKEAVTIAMKDGRPGDVLLFSPGFASFGLFKNEYDRNDQFVECVNQYA